MRNPLSIWSDRRDQFRALQREVNHMFREFMAPEWREDLPTLSTDFAPPCDVEETPSHYLLSMDLPGINKNDIKIELNEDQLRIYGERKEEHRETKKPPYRSERYYGSFERRMTLPNNVKAEQVEAHFENGVLRVAIPKAEATLAKQIPISEGKSGFFAKLLSKKEAPPGPEQKMTSTSGAKEKVA